MAASSPRPGASAPPRAPRWSRRRTGILFGLLALGVGIRIALPELVRWQIESQASKTLGRKVEVADVDLGLVMGRASIEGLAVGGPDLVAPVDPASSVVRCASVGARIAWLPLLTGKLRLREIALVDPMLRLDRTPDGAIAPLVLAAAEPESVAEPEPAPEAEEEGGGIDLAIERLSLDGAELRLVRQRDAASIAELRFQNLTLGDLSFREEVVGVGAVALRGPELQLQADTLAAEEGAQPAPQAVSAAPPSAAPPPPSPEPAAEPAKHRVQALDIEGARFVWRLPDGEAVQTELELHARDLGMSGSPFPLEIEFSTERASHALKGELALEPLHFEGSYRWEGLRLDRLALFAPELPVKLASGRSDGELEISLRLPPGAPNAPPGLRLQGDVRVAELDLASGDGALALRWKDLSLALAPLSLPLGEAGAAPEIHLTKLALLEPQVEYLLQPAAADAADEPAGPQPVEAAAPESPSAPPRVAIDALELTGGTLRFRDTSVRPPVDTSLRELRIRAQGVRWPERDVAKLLLSARGQRGATLKLEGRIVAGSGGAELDLRQLPLATFDPYAGSTSGLKIEGGRLSLASKLTLAPDRLGAKSTLALHQLSLTERESGWFQQAFGVPLDVALALLRDMQGDITLPVDVEQGAGGTRVGIAAAVGSALRQALVGALAAPLKLLGSVASKAGETLSTGLEPIPMEPGHGELTPAAHERVAALAQLLDTRPGLGVLLVGRADASDDALLARREVLARAKAGEPLAGEDELGFFERRRVRSALADADPDQTDALDAETAAALERLAGQVSVSEDARQALALARAQAVALALQQEHGAPAAAVAAIETQAGAPAVAIELRAQ